MSTVRKLSAFRQLSLNCTTPTSEQRRKSLKKQFSEDTPDTKPPKARDIKIAWAEPSSPKDEGVIAKKCIKEAKRMPRITRHHSLESDSILYSKQELAQKLRHALQEREQQAQKPNLNIILTPSTRDYTDEEYEAKEPEAAMHPSPRIIPPLLDFTSRSIFQIRKNKHLSCASPKSSAIVVIPIIPKDTTPKELEDQDSKAIKEIIIRPATTASAKRQLFQKRTNSAFHSVVKESLSRAPLVRSSSAPTKPEQSKPKFLATKKKIKSAKRRELKHPVSDDESSKENPKSRKEINRFVAVNGSDIVTMVSLVSPAESEEEVEEEKIKIEKVLAKPALAKKEEKDGGRNISLRKTVKSVSFQQSSIHAIRSFSASFPGRRGSMATAIMLGNHNVKNGPKAHEKRAPNTSVAEDDEREPKRRLVRSATERPFVSCSNDESEKVLQGPIAKESEIKINMISKTATSEDTNDESTIPTDSNIERPLLDSALQNEIAEPKENLESGTVLEQRFGTIKEKQCWDTYCKMKEKGLQVSYETILRGMLTPTEYRMRKKEEVVEIEEIDTNATQPLEK